MKKEVSIKTIRLNIIIEHQRDLLAARNIKKFGLQKQNLIVRVGATQSAC